MNGVAANGMDRSSAGARRHVRVAVPLLLSLAACSALAREEVPPAPASSIVTESPDQRMKPAQLEVSTSLLPQFDNTDGSSRASRIDMTWLPPRPSGLGLAMGMSLGMTSTTRPGHSTGGPSLQARPNLDLGFHWRYTLDSQHRIDFTAWHRMAPADAIDLVQAREPTYGARLEMRLGSMPRRGFVADRGFLGLQLEGGARISVRRNDGRPMLYYRARF